MKSLKNLKNKITNFIRHKYKKLIKKYRKEITINKRKKKLSIQVTNKPESRK